MMYLTLLLIGIFMNKMSRLKKTAKNEFTAITGVMAFEALGNGHCLITRSAKRAGFSTIQRFAVVAYNNDIHDLNRYVSVKSTCGYINCVKRDHLVAKYIPPKKDVEYIVEHLKLDGVEHLAHIFSVPVKLMDEFIHSITSFKK